MDSLLRFSQEAQQKYQAMLIDHAAVLKERDTLGQQLQEAQLAANRHLEEAKTAQAILSSSQKSWELQADSLKQEVADMQSRLVPLDTFQVVSFHFSVDMRL